MRFSYFVYTNGERVEKSTTWGAKFATQNFPLLGEAINPTGSKSRLQLLGEDYVKLCQRLEVSPSFDHSREFWCGDCYGFVLLPGWGQGLLAGVYRQFRDETDRPNISLVAAFVPPEVQQAVAPSVFFANLLAENDIDAIARPRLDGFVARQAYLQIDSWNAANDSTLTALAAEAIDWAELKQAVIAIDGTVYYTQKNSTVKKRTEYPGYAQLVSSHIAGSAPEPNMPAPTDLASKTNGTSAQARDEFDRAQPLQEKVDLAYCVVTSGEWTSEKKKDIDWGVKFVSPRFPGRDDREGAPLVLVHDDYKALLEQYEGGSIGFDMYWPTDENSFGYALLPWSECCSLAVIYHRFRDSASQHERLNISAVVMAVPREVRKRVSPAELFALAQKQNDIVRIARPQRNESERFPRPPVLAVDLTATTADLIARDASLDSLQRTGIGWNSVDTPWMIVNGQVTKLQYKSVTTVGDEGCEIPIPPAKPWWQRHLLKLIAVAAFALLLLYAYIAFRSRNKLENELQTMRQQLAQSKAKNDQLREEVQKSKEQKAPTLKTQKGVSHE